MVSERETVSRVLLVHQPTDGGVGRHIRDLGLGLRARGYDVILCGPDRPAGLPAGIKHVRLDLQRALVPRGDLVGVLGLAKIVRKVNPDVIHAHSSKAGAIAKLARLAYPRVPVVYTPHGYAFAGYFASAAERRVYRILEQALAPLASCVLCVCEAEGRLARSIGPCDRVRVVHNGVEPAPVGSADPRLRDLSCRGPVIGALTLLRSGKGLETLIDATAAVVGRHPDAQVVIFGEGPDLARLTARAELRGVRDAVHFVGPTDDPPTALRGLDIFVHPSWAESCPYVILEAMSLGKAIIATDVGGISEAVMSGDSGQLVRPRDAAGLAGAIVTLLENPRRRSLLGAAALERLRDRFTTSAMVDGVVRVYDQLVQSEGGAGAVASLQRFGTTEGLVPG